MRYSVKYTLLTWALFLSVATATTINVPADYSSIQAALTAADSSDTVLVQPGTYVENIFWPNVNGIKLISAGDSSNTVIDGSGNGSVIYLNPIDATIDSTTEIRGFKITNGGNITYGGGMFVSNASPVLTQLWVTGNTATSNGGGLYIEYGSPTLTDMTVSGNTANNSGGGLYIGGGSPTLTGVTVTDNTALRGGGLFSLDGSPTLTDVTVTGNTAGYGGGLNIWYGSPTLTNVTVTGNTGSYAGGLYIRSSPTLTDVTVTGNTTSHYGGGLYIYFGSPTLTDVTVSGNTAWSGGGLYIQQGSNPTLTDVTVTGNIATADGGGLYVEKSSPVLTDVTVGGNSAYRGAGLHITERSSPALSRMTVSGNFGEGLYYFYFSSGTLVNSTITGNTQGIYVESGTPTIAGSNIAYHGAALYNADNSNIIAATNNWWGNSSGPYHPLQNEGGLGDSVNTFVNITPFLTEPDTAAPPIPVQNLVVTNQGADFIELAWDASPIGDLAGYKIYYDSDSSRYPYANSLDVGTVTSYTLSGLSLITDQYFIAVTCYDTDGNESWYSSEAATSIIDIVPPASPQNLSAQAGDKLVTLTWTANTENDFLRYRIYEGTTANPVKAIDSTESILDTTKTISGLNNVTTYYYRVTAIDTSGNESGFSNEVSATPTALAVDESAAIPTSFALHANYPNPFNPVTTIRYDLPEQSEVALVVYDIIGREIIRLVNSHLEAGYHLIVWDAKDRTGREVSTGIYIARISTPEFTKSIKMVLLK